MGMHAVLYRSQQAIGATNASLSAVPYSQDVVYNNKILPQTDMELLLSTTYGVDVSAARIQTPLLIQTASNHLRPWGIAATAGNNPNTGDFFDQPVQFRRNEGIDVQTSNANAAAQIHTCVLQLGNKNYSVPSGQRLKIYASAAQTLTANVWNYVPLTYQDNLPDKLFAVVGFEALSATGLIARLDIPGQAWKPGYPVVNTIANRMFWKQYEPIFGELGRFRNTSLPNLELYATAADTAQQVWMDVVVLG